MHIDLFPHAGVWQTLPCMHHERACASPPAVPRLLHVRGLTSAAREEFPRGCKLAKSFFRAAHLALLTGLLDEILNKNLIPAGT